jgi:hypothetical protein
MIRIPQPCCVCQALFSKKVKKFPAIPESPPTEAAGAASGAWYSRHRMLCSGMNGASGTSKYFQRKALAAGNTAFEEKILSCFTLRL